MFAVLVTFQIKTECVDAFLPLMKDNAVTSLQKEPGCHVFDICKDGPEVFLYELYEDRAAFDVHLDSDHFLAFDAAVADMVADKQVRLYDEVIR
ncbi:MAG: antibiotic biosynthesis monooxygenase [Cognatishimia sp.]|uniref:putative quinol monooxygenase n=1 Tax=Cognatishimia sp. TaxID=2211648 RepID=UPI003B8C8995